MISLCDLVGQAIQKKEEEKANRDDDSPYGWDIDYVDASSHDVVMRLGVDLEVVEIVDPEVGRIDDDILSTIKDDTFFADGTCYIISLSGFDHFCFKIEPELGNLTMDVVEDIFPTREPRVHVPNVLTQPSHPGILGFSYF
ncbi:hypothetical protein Tco_1318864 [Tanacetum coccineum]